MPIDVIRSAAGVKDRASHLVRTGTEMVIREGRGLDGEKTTHYSAMGVCGTEASGVIISTEMVKDVSCKRCATQAARRLTPEPEPVPVLSSPETTQEPRVRSSRTPGRERHGRVRYERAERRRKMKEAIR